MKRTPDKSMIRIDGAFDSRSASLEALTMSSSPLTASTSGSRRTADGDALVRKVRRDRSCEDADSAGTDEQPKDDEDDPEQELSTNRGDDAGDDEDDGENPQHRGHETSKMFSDRKLRSPSTQPPLRAVVHTPGMITVR